MKKHMILVGMFLVVVMMIATGCASKNETTNIPANTENLRIAEIGLPGMFCQACAQNSENTFANMPGVVEVNVDIGAKKGTVVYDSSVISKEQLVQEGLIQAYDGKIIKDQEYS